MFVSVFFYLFALILGLLFLRVHSLFYKGPLVAILISLIGHALGAYAYSFILSDSSTQYFPDASPYFNGLGTNFVKNIVWYVRKFSTGDSLIATFNFFSAFAFFGSISWYVLYLRIINNLNISGKTFFFPALILMCWPSFCFFGAGMGKDSLSFCFIPLVFLSYFNLTDKKDLLSSILVFCFSFVVLICLRPYFAMIFLVAYYFYTMRDIRSLNLWNILGAIAVLVVALHASHWVLSNQGGFNSINLDELAERSMRQQEYQAKGTHFYMPSASPLTRVVFLPYSVVMNLFFPLFYLAKNVMGLASSLENVVLVYFFWRIVKWRQMLLSLLKEDRRIKFLITFFIVGMIFMSAVNTNLGLSVRQKMMYLPGMLVIYCVLYVRVKTCRFLRG